MSSATHLTADSNQNPSPTLLLLGLAIGIGNFSELPLAIINGGIVFIAIYAICVGVLCIPLALVEAVAGGYWQKPKPSIAVFFQQLCNSIKIPQFSTAFQAITLITNSFILLASIVLLGWLLYCAWMLFSGVFVDLTKIDTVTHFSNLSSSFTLNAILIGCSSILILAMLMHRSQKWTQGLVVILFILLICFALLMIYLTGHYNTNHNPYAFLINQQPFVEMLLSAMTMALLSVGAGSAMIALIFSHQPYSECSTKSLSRVIGIDALIGLSMALILYNLHSIHGIEIPRASSIELLFISLPVIFSNMPGGLLAGSLFYGIVALATLTTMMVMIYIITRYFDGTIKLLAATLSSLVLLAIVAQVTDIHLLGLLYFSTQDLLIPIISLLFLIVIGWGLPLDRMHQELSGLSERHLINWYNIIKYLTPIIIILLLIANIIGDNILG